MRLISARRPPTLAVAAIAATLLLHACARAERSAPPAAALEPAPVSRDVVLERGDTIDGILARAGISADQRRSADAALRERTDPRRLRAGTRVELTIRQDAGAPPRLLALHIDLYRTRDITLVAHEDGHFGPARGDRIAEPALHAVAGVAGRDFDASLRAAGLPSDLVPDVRAALSYDRDLPDVPPPGTGFRVVFATQEGASDVVRHVTVADDGRSHSVYRYRVGNGLVAFVSPSGRGILKPHFAKPVRGAVITSPWGWRMHPILKRPEFHKGIDMAAPLGTPVRAAADGRVVFAGRHGNYGELVKIRHTEHLMTTYGHLQRFARGLHSGQRVTRGQVIGYVGQTGLSTGPHLYFEVFADGRRVNPAGKNLSVPVKLAGRELQRFRRVAAADSQATGD